MLYNDSLTIINANPIVSIKTKFIFKVLMLAWIDVLIKLKYNNKILYYEHPNWYFKYNYTTIRRLVILFSTARLQMKTKFVNDCCTGR